MVMGLKVVEGIFGKLSEHFVINSPRCVRVRHKAAKCADCMDVCPRDAITVTAAGGRVLVDWTRCSDCGKCLTACRNGVFSLRKVDRERLLASAASRIDDGSTVALACRNSPYVKEAAYAAGTLAFFNRRHMVRLIAMGATNIVALKGDCTACDNACAELMDKELARTRRIVSLCGVRADINLADEYEPRPATKECNKPKASSEDEKLTSRREFFGYLKNRALVSVGSTIQYLTENEANTKKTVLTADSTATELEEYIDSLRAIGGEALLCAMTNEGLLNEVRIDMERCSLCGICSRMCPNGVFTLVTDLVKGRQETVDIRKASEFCTGCGLCELSCPCKVISIAKER